MAEPFNPKKQFQSNTLQCQRFAELISDPVMDRAITVTIAELFASGLSPDRMAGVGNFIETFRNLAEPEKVPKPLPTRHLSLDDPKPKT